MDQKVFQPNGAAHIAQLIATILEKKVSGVGLHGEVGA